MRLCKALRPSSARIGQCRYQSQPTEPYSCRSYSAESAQHGIRAPSRPNTVPAVQEPLKIDQENKTIETAVGDLPLSPVMDPSFWEATQKHKTPKAKPDKPKNSVERQLRANAFAKALATPVRRCGVTQTRLPSFFLQDFNLISRPQTDTPWWVPRSLTLSVQPVLEEADSRGIQEIIQEEESLESQGIDEAGARKSMPEKEHSEDTTQAVRPDREHPYGPSAYTLARQDLLSSFMDGKSGFRNTPRRLFNGSSSRFKVFSGRAVWRADMDGFILALMRQAIVDDILYLSRLCTNDNRYYIAKCYGWDDIQFKHKGAVLWFGEPGQTAALDNTQSQPGPFATFDVQGEADSMSVIVHNMPMLLGIAHTKKIREEAAALKDGSIFMLAGRRTTELQLKLWKLQGYLADYRDED